MNNYLITSPVNFEITQEQYNLLTKWITELKSGNYKQGRGDLCDNQDRYCCIGVLANISPNFTKLKRKNDNVFIKVHNTDAIYGVDLGKEFVTITGIDNVKNINSKGLFSIIVNNPSQNVVQTSKSFENLLIHMNDDIKLTFTDIGEVLESFVNTYVEVKE